MKPIVDTLDKENCTALFSGDFNINLLEINDREKYQEYFDLFVTRAFYPKLTLPTRFSKKRATLIDQIFCRTADINQKSTSGIFVSNLSDHLHYFVCLDVCKKKRQGPSKFIKVNPKLDSNVVDALCHDIRSSLIQAPLNADMLANPNENYNRFEQILSESRLKHLPSKFVKFRKHRHKLSPWITSGILHSIKFKDNLYKNFKSTRPETPSYDSQKINLHTYQSILNKNIRLVKTSYYSEQLNKYSKDIKKTWQTLNGIIKKCKPKKEFPNFFYVNEEQITDVPEIANHFNLYFANIGSNLSASITYDGEKTVQNYLKNRIMFSFTFHSVTMEDVLKTVQNLASKSSCGHDEISTKLLKLIIPSISSPLTLIINQSLNTGIFPDRLKIA